MNAFHPADLAVFAGYFAVFTAIAFWAGRKKKDDAADFFIQQNKLPWYAIGFSMIASGISSEQFIGTVGFAYSTGLSVANWEWANGPSLWKRMNANAAFITLSLVFPMLVVPYLLRMLDVGMNAFNVAGLVAIATVVLVVILGFVTRPTGTEDDTMVFTFTRGKTEAVVAPFYQRVGFWAAAMMLIYAVVYAVFW